MRVTIAAKVAHLSPLPAVHPPISYNSGLGSLGALKIRAMCLPTGCEPPVTHDPSASLLGSAR